MFCSVKICLFIFTLSITTSYGQNLEDSSPPPAFPENSFDTNGPPPGAASFKAPAGLSLGPGGGGGGGDGPYGPNHPCTWDAYYHGERYLGFNPCTDSVSGPSNGFTAPPLTGPDPSYSYSVRKLEHSSKKAGLSGPSRLLFSDIVDRAGTGWNENTSEFQPQTGGTYFFTFTIMGENNKNFRVDLMHNNQGIVSAYGGGNGYEQASNSAVLFLYPDDKVYLELAEGELYETGPHGSSYNSLSYFKIM